MAVQDAAELPSGVANQPPGLGRGAPAGVALHAPARPVGRVERWIGPDNYKILRGLLVTPTSVAGLIILAVFALIAVGAPLIAPPLSTADPYRIPRTASCQTRSRWAQPGHGCSRLCPSGGSPSCTATSGFT